MPNTHLRGKTIERLMLGVIEKSDLISKLAKENNVTIQGIYKVLNELQKEETITIHGKNVGLSLFWIDRELSRWNQTAYTYQSPSRGNAFLELNVGECLKLRFKTLRELELYWTHSFLLLETKLPLALPAYSIAPHDWFYYARPESDELWVRRQKNRIQRLIITHPAMIDRNVRKERKSPQFENMFGVNPFDQLDTEYKNIIGEWIFEAKLDATINKQLTEWILSHDTFAKDERRNIDTILDMRGVFSLRISRLPKRTASMVKKLKKYF